MRRHPDAFVPEHPEADSLTSAVAEGEMARQAHIHRDRPMHCFSLSRAVGAPLLAAFLLSACATTVRPERCYHLNASVESQIGYCQAIRVDNRLYVSGSVGKGEMPSAIRGAYGELETTLAAHGLSFRNVVKETVFTTNLDDFIKYKDIRKEFYGDTYPTGSWVQVERLYSPAFVVEVEVEAVFP